MFLGGLADAGIGVLADGRAVFLNAAQQFKGGLRACAAAARFQSHAHHPVEDERQKADQGVGTDALGAMIDRRDLQIALQDAKAALDVGEFFIASDDLGSGEVVDAGQEHELAVEALGPFDRGLIDTVAEALGLIVGLDEAGEFGLRERALKSAVGPAVGGTAAALGEPFILSVKLADQFLGKGFELRDARTPPGRLLGRA